MSKQKLSPAARTALGALMAHLAPKIAQDAKIDLVPALDGLTRENFGEKQAGVVEAVKKAAEGKLAAGVALDDLDNLMGAVGSYEQEHGADAYDAEGGAMAKLCEFLKGKLTPEDYAQVEAMLKPGGGAQDTPPEFPGMPKPGGEMVGKAAMDEAVKKAGEDAATKARAEAKAVRQAERDVRPYVGELAMDGVETAADVYRAAFKVLGVDVKDVHDSAFPALLKAQRKPDKAAGALAQDAAGEKPYAERFPEAARLSA